MGARLRIWRTIIWHGWRAMMTILLGAAISLVLFVRDEVLPDKLQARLHLSALPSLPLWLWTAIVAVLFIFLILEGAYRIVARAETGMATLRQDFDSFRERTKEQLRPKVMLWFDESDPSCIQVTQTPKFRERRLRMGIRNIGGQTIEDVRVDIYLSDTPFNPTPMSFMHEPPSHTSITLHPEETRYVDMFGTYEGSGAPTEEVVIYYAVGISNTMPRSRRHFGIEAVGKDIQSCSGSFELNFPTKQEPMIRLLSESDMADSQPQ